MSPLISILASLCMMPADGAARPTEWAAITSAASHVRFDMPLMPMERSQVLSDGSSLRLFACEKDGVLYQAISFGLAENLQMAMREAISDAEDSVGRHVLDETVESFMEGAEGKIQSGEYLRFKKLPSRKNVIALSDRREAKVIASLGKDRVYIFLTISAAGQNKAPITRFFNSIEFQN